jgi:hypothetical protein
MAEASTTQTVTRPCSVDPGSRLKDITMKFIIYPLYKHDTQAPDIHREECHATINIRAIRRNP